MNVRFIGCLHLEYYNRRINKKMNNNKLYNWLFHYNDYTKKWAAFKRDSKVEYFNNQDRSKQTGILYADDITTLFDFITKGK